MNALHEELMAAYAEAEGLLGVCLETGSDSDVEAHRTSLRRAFRLSDAYHQVADQVMFRCFLVLDDRMRAKGWDL